MEDHKKRKHAILSASGAERWFNCTPSARLEDVMGVKTTSVFAEEGTTAHELADLMLTRDMVEEMTEDEFTDKLAIIMDKPSFNDEMFVEIPKYIEYCTNAFEEAKAITPDAIIAIEQKVDLSAYIKDGFGSCDCVIIADGTMEVIDLKYGRGVSVSATANKQLMLYGLGALMKFAFMYDVQRVKLTIVQPRIDNISSWEITIDDLMLWADNDLTEKAKIAFAGEGELNAGSWCKFCSVKNKCPKLSETNLEVAKYEFAKPELLTDDDIAKIMLKIPLLIEWANSISEYALSEAISKNKVWPGFKLVEGQSRRKWVDEATVVKTLRSNFPSLEDDDIFNTTLKGITDIEKLLTKKVFAEKMKDVVIKPQGKLTLVQEGDKRDAIGLGQAIKDFK